MTQRTTIRAAHRRGVKTAPRDRSDRGDTLIEILMTLVVLSITCLGLIVAFGTSLSASVEHRGLAANDVVLRSAAESAISQIQQQSTKQSATPYQSCATPLAYISTNNFGAPSPYTALVTAVTYWSAATAAFVSSPCVPNTPELVTLTVTNTTTGTHVFTNFVVDARGQNSAAAFSVVAASPASVAAGSTQTVSLTGTGFLNGATVSFSGSGVSASATTVSSATALIVNVTASSGALAGAYTITVTNPGGASVTSGPIFTVTGNLSVTSVSPSSLNTGASNQSLSLTGTGFVSGATVSFSGNGVTAGAATVSSPTAMTFNVSISNSAASGTRTITVTNPGGASATSGPIFTVNTAPSTVLDVNLMIGSFDGTKKNAWDAMVTIDVVDSNDNAIGGVTVTGTWDTNQNTFTSTCTTNATGSCVVEDGVSLNLGANNSSVTFTVSSLAKTGYTYNSSGNFANPASAKVSQP
jgi:type II secretory pathway pseudopilin PulG